MWLDDMGHQVLVDSGPTTSITKETGLTVGATDQSSPFPYKKMMSIFSYTIPFLGKSICAKTCFSYLIHPMNQIVFPSGLNHCLTQHMRRSCRLSLPRLLSWLSPSRGGEKAGKRFYKCVKRGVRSWMEHDFEVWKKIVDFPGLVFLFMLFLQAGLYGLIRSDTTYLADLNRHYGAHDVVPPQQAGDEAQWWR